MTTAGTEPKTTSRTIAAAIREQIRSGQLRPGSALPSSRELAQHFGVTSKTVNAGIDLLKLEGLVVGEQGGRRRVRADRRITWNLSAFERGARRDSSTMDDWAAPIAEAGREPHETVSASVIQAEPQVAAWLKIAPGSDVVKRTRIRSVDEEPFQLSTSFFPGDFAIGTLLTEDREVSVPGGILQHIGYPQVRLRDEITIRMPTPEESELLDLPMGTPVAQHVRIGYGTDRPVRVMITIAPGDRHRLVYEMEV